MSEHKPVFELPGGKKLNRQEFLKYFENKVYKTIRQFKLLGSEEYVGVAVSGGKDSLSTLHLIHKLSEKNPKIKVEAMCIDEGIAGYRDETIVTAQAFCDERDIKLHIFSYKEEFGMSLDEILKVLDIKPCSICGVFRRYLMNKKSKELGFTKLATGHNLDDEAQSIVMNQFRGDVKASARLGPMSGVNQVEGFVQRIKPLYMNSEKEVTTYAFLKKFLDRFTECPNACEAYRGEVRELINGFEVKHPGTKHAIIQSFLDVLPSLKERYKDEPVGICTECGEPSSKDRCKTCEYVEQLRKVKQKA